MLDIKECWRRLDEVLCYHTPHPRKTFYRLAFEDLQRHVGALEAQIRDRTPDLDQKPGH